MKTPEEKEETIRQQVISKIHWGASSDEVMDWLEEDHGISGAKAEEFLETAFRERVKEVRVRALFRLCFSVVGIVLVIGFFYIRFFSGVIFYGLVATISTIFAIGIALLSVTTCCKSSIQLLTGRTHGAVDK